MPKVWQSGMIYCGQETSRCRESCGIDDKLARGEENEEVQTSVCCLSEMQLEEELRDGILESGASGTVSPELKEQLCQVCDWLKKSLIPMPWNCL